MKKLMVALTIAMLASAASAAILATDDFSYTGAATANGWSAYSGTDSSITANGSVLAVGSGAEDIRTTFADQLTGSVFASVVLNLSAAPASGGAYTLGFSDGTAMEGRFGLVGEAGSLFGITLYGTGTTILGTVSGLSYSTDYTITMGITASAISLWVNSDGTDELSPDLTTAGVANGIDGFFVRQATPFGAGSASYTLDNMAVGQSFSDVAPAAVPEPATMSLLGLGALAMVLRRKMKK